MTLKAQLQYSDKVLRVDMAPGERIICEPGVCMAFQNMEMATSNVGGFMESCKRSFFGGSGFQNTFTATSNNSWIEIAPTSPGSITTFTLNPGTTLYVKRGSFLAASSHIKTSVMFTGVKGLRAGQSVFLELTAPESPAQVWFGAGGRAIAHEMNEDPLVVDNDNCIAYLKGAEWSVYRPGGMRSRFKGGEGKMMKFKGSGVVWLQTSLTAFGPPRSG